MNEILTLFGKVAGIGGLALGVFLFLFRKIKLPPATRRHLTLFMWLVWSIAVLGIVIYAASLFISPERVGVKQSGEKIPKFSGYINITYHDETFAKFLEANVSRVVALDGDIDLSVAVEEQQNRLDAIGGFELLDKFEEKPSDVRLQLPTEDLNYIEFDLLNGRKLPQGAGGTGMVLFPIRGYFEISRTYNAGPSKVYYLTEVVASLQERAHL